MTIPVSIEIEGQYGSLRAGPDGNVYLDFAKDYPAIEAEYGARPVSMICADDRATWLGLEEKWEAQFEFDSVEEATLFKLRHG